MGTVLRRIVWALFIASLLVRAATIWIPCWLIAWSTEECQAGGGGSGAG